MSSVRPTTIERRAIDRSIDDDGVGWGRNVEEYGSVLADRFRSQLLSGPAATDPVHAVGHLLAVQGQDRRGFRLAVRARTTGTTAADVDRALTVDRSLVVSWLHRGTLHLVRAEDHPWLHALMASRMRTGNDRRLVMEGVPLDAADQAVKVIERAVTNDGPLTRAALAERIEATGIVVAGQGLVHVLLRATLDGLIVRGPVVGNEQAFVLTRDWLGPAPHVDVEQAVIELCRRYLAGHAPADERDLATWAGLPLGMIRKGLAAVAPDVDEATGGLVPRGWSSSGPPPPLPRLLGSFEPVLHGWRDRSWVLGDRTGIVTTNGIFRPIALADGRAVGTWTLPAGVVHVQPFGPLTKKVVAALTSDAADVLRYLGRPVPAAPLVMEAPRG
jgi:hypothetical protein